MPVKVGKAMRNNELRGPTAIDTDIIPSDSEHVFAQEALYQEAMMRYHCAILEMRTKLEVLSKDMTVRYRRNPIEFIESRLKKPSSIARKLKQKLSPDCRNSGVFQRQGAAGAMRNSDPHDCNGLLGDARPRYAIQKAGGGQRGHHAGTQGMRGCDPSDGRKNDAAARENPPH